MGAMHATKGTVFVTLRAFVREHYDEHALQLLLEALPEEDRATVEIATSNTWYDFDTRVRALRAWTEPQRRISGARRAHA